MDKQKFMARALELAERGLYTAHPNPRVGCVLVKDNSIVGEGYHHQTGGAHAEIEALAQAGAKAEGATCYVTLEPCSHYGRTGPCVEALIKAGIAHCIIATKDPNPQVCGKGIEALNVAGIQVEVGLMQNEAKRLNQGFFRRMQHNKPNVTLKIAASLDGKTAMQSGESKWITSNNAREDVHRLRAESGAILIGVNTVIKDNPFMTVRDESILSQSGFKQPLRVILDTHLRTPVSANIFTQPGHTMVVIGNNISRSKQEAWLSHFSPREDIELVSVNEVNQRVSLTAVLAILAEKQINDVLVEAGQTLSGCFLKEGLVDYLVLYMAPKLLGINAKGIADVPGLHHLQDHIGLTVFGVSQIGPDIKIIASPSIEREQNDVR